MPLGNDVITNAKTTNCHLISKKNTHNCQKVQKYRQGHYLFQSFVIRGPFLKVEKVHLWTRSEKLVDMWKIVEQWLFLLLPCCKTSKVTGIENHVGLAQKEIIGMDCVAISASTKELPKCNVMLIRICENGGFPQMLLPFSQTKKCKTIRDLLLYQIVCFFFNIVQTAFDPLRLFFEHLCCGIADYIAK